jgi:hypothetical protein
MLKSYQFKAFNCLDDIMINGLKYLIQPDSFFDFFRCCCTNKNALIHKEWVQSTTQHEKHSTIQSKFSEIARNDLPTHHATAILKLNYIGHWSILTKSPIISIDCEWSLLSAGLDFRACETASYPGALVCYVIKRTWDGTRGRKTENSSGSAW